MDLILDVKRVLLDERVIRERQAIVIAVSGGPDSMVLLHVMSRLAETLRVKLVAAHMNHGFRPEEGELEADTVRRFAESLGIELAYRRVDVPEYAETERMNAQAAARELRYRFLFDTAAANGTAAVMLAHHLDDQAETILLHLFGGTALGGLSGMPILRMVNNMKLIRPMLRIDKDRIMAYAREWQVPYCVDSSNRLRKYDRNRLRLDVMPQLRAFNPQLPQALSRMADVLRQEDDYMQAQTSELFERIARLVPDAIHVNRQAFVREPLALQRRLIKLILSYLSSDSRTADYDHIESIRQAIMRESPPSATLAVDAKLRFERVYDKLSWDRVDPAAREAAAGPAYAYELRSDDRSVALPEARGVMNVAAVHANGQASRAADCWEAVFDADQLTWPLTIRSRRDGDRIEPLGVNGSKKVKDLFIDLKVEPWWRSRVPLLVDGENRLLWIPGIRRSRHAMVAASTDRLIRLRFERTDDR